MRVNIDYDISKDKTRLGDYALDDLEEMIVIKSLHMQTNKKIVHLNWTRSFKGDLTLILKDIRIKLSCQNELGYTGYNGERIKMQDDLDEMFNILNLHYQDQIFLWDLHIYNKEMVKGSCIFQADGVDQEVYGKQGNWRFN